MPNILKDGSFSKRHRGTYTPNHPAPYELSRGRIENFLKLKALFWLEQVKGVKPPKMPGFTINTTTDVLLKRDADQVRGKATLPLWEAHGLGHLIPFQHEDLENWTNSMQFGKGDEMFSFVHSQQTFGLAVASMTFSKTSKQAGFTLLTTRARLKEPIGQILLFSSLLGCAAQD